jgi:hypothetical protein
MQSAGVTFDYEIYAVKDGLYGAVNDKEEWNGMIGELVKGVRVAQGA